MNTGEKIAYAVFKEVARYSFIDWLETWEISKEDWDKFMEAGKKVFEDDINDSPTIESQKWTPCFKKNPKESGWYIVTLDDGGLSTYRFYSKYKNLWEHIGGKVIAWMPMPKPYGGEKE